MPAMFFEATPADARLIRAIARRAFDCIQAFRAAGLTQLDLEMDLRACHLNGCPLRLPELLRANDLTLAYDVRGINQHIDRATGRLDGNFRPRLANYRAAA